MEQAAVEDSCARGDEQWNTVNCVQLACLLINHTTNTTSVTHSCVYHTYMVSREKKTQPTCHCNKTTKSQQKVYLKQAVQLFNYPQQKLLTTKKTNKLNVTNQKLVIKNHDCQYCGIWFYKWLTTELYVALTNHTHQQHSYYRPLTGYHIRSPYTKKILNFRKCNI